MRSLNQPATILVVDDDEVLRQVLCRVLAREGHTIVPAADAVQALNLADQQPPDLALLDLCLPGSSNGVNLARDLHQRQGDLPLILMTAFPVRLLDHPELAGQFQRILTKPLDLDALRQAVATALIEEPMQRPTSLVPQPEVVKPATTLSRPAPAAKRSVASSVRSGLVVVLALLGLAVFVGYMAGVQVPWQSGNGKEKTVSLAPPMAVELVSGTAHTLSVPEDVRTILGIRKGKEELIAVARKPSQSLPLIIPGSTSLDPTRLMRIRIRFTPAEVIEIPQVRDEFESLKSGRSEFRELRSGDSVKKGDLLAVLYSVDVGTKKNELIDALVAIRLDLDILEKSEEAFSKGALPEINLLTARKNVEADRNAIAKALNTLKTWNIPEEDIEAVYNEADQINKRKGKRDEDKAKQWPRVELRAPADGTIVERNVSLRETIVDNTLNLFQIAQVDRLLVSAYAPEDQLPNLLKLETSQRRWTIQTVGAPKEGISGPINEIGYLIDPNQHSAVLKGYIDNPEGKLRSTQLISAIINLPPPEDVVEIPMSAIVDDGKQCVVFVQADEKKHHYTLRRLRVTHRFDKTAFVRSKLSEDEAALKPEEKEEGLLPPQPLKEGERVLGAGVLELKKELEDRESKAQTETK